LRNVCKQMDPAYQRAEMEELQRMMENLLDSRPK
jgi:hypothetical protein